MAKKKGTDQAQPKFEYMDAFTIEQYEEEYYDSEESDDYEKACELIEQENDRYLDEFYEDLKAAGLKDATINKHIDNVYFYLNTYLVREAPLHMRAGCYKVDSFLGNFFIRKCMWSTPASIRSNAASFKKFYQSMLKRNHIAQEDYDYLVSTIKEEKQQWCDLCAEFNDPYSENPFSPFPSDMWGGFDVDAPPDFSEDTVREVAMELLSSIFGENMTREEMIQALEQVDAEFGRQLELLDADDDTIVQTLGEMGFVVDRSTFERLVPSCADEYTLMEKIAAEIGMEIDEESPETDLALTGLGELWARWMPDELAFTSTLDAIADGYSCDSSEWRMQLEAWDDAWEGVKRAAALESPSFITSDTRVVFEHSIPEWLCDYQRALVHAAMVEPNRENVLNTFMEERAHLESLADGEPDA